MIKVSMWGKAETGGVLFKLYAMKTNHLYISLLSSHNVIFVNRFVKCDTAIYGNWEYLNAQGVYVIFF